MHTDGLKTLEYHKVIDLLKAQASSTLGHEIAVRLKPSNVYEDVKHWLEETAEGKCILDHGAAAPLGGIRDIRVMLKKSRLGAVLDAQELLQIQSTLYAMRMAKKFFRESEIETPILKELAGRIEIVGQLENSIEAMIDERGNLRDDASVELLRIRRELKGSQNRVKERLDSVLRTAEYQKFFQDNIVTMRGDRYVVPIKQEYRQFFPGLIHDQSASGATLFIEPMAVVQLNNDIKQLEAAEKHEIERILRMITLKIAKSADILEQNTEVLAQLDFIFAKAKLAIHMEASLPVLNKAGHVDLKKARHPLIDAGTVVPIDIALGKAYQMLLITGPNTGGKTVSIKTLGLLALMAQSGLFIPALSGSVLPVYRSIYADIGDEQSIEQSLSTFSAHMTHLVRILTDIEAEDLLLVDEIGAGTDPEEGAALAMAILEHLLGLGTSVVATTHYSELKTFAYSKDGIENASVEFDEVSLRPTYRLLTGIPGTSNAFAISKRLGLADSLILRARQLIDADHAQFEKVLNHLETEKLQYEQKNAAILEREARIAALEQKMQQIRADLAARKERILRKAQEDSASLVRRTRREMEEIIKALKEQYQDHGAKKRQEVFDRSRQRLRSQAENFQFEPQLAAHHPVVPERLEAGDPVYVATLGQKGAVLSVGTNDVVVQLGMMKTTVPLSACRQVEPERGKAKIAESKTTQIAFQKVRDVSRQIDIRGMLVEEGEAVVSKYLDDAVLAGLSQVIVIHGKGTGALRKGIHAYLKSHRLVRDISICDAHEGGDGATVVRLM